MPVSEKSRAIHAPTETVFRYLANPLNLPLFWPNIVEVRNVKRLTNGRQKFDWTYKMSSVRLEGCSETTDTPSHQRFITTLKGGFHGTIDWTLEAENDLTNIKIVFNYDIPAPLLKKHPADFIMRQNEADLETVLDNLKKNIETHIHA
jgi:uncharacterized membrane protein